MNSLLARSGSMLALVFSASFSGAAPLPALKVSSPVAEPAAFKSNSADLTLLAGRPAVKRELENRPMRFSPRMAGSPATAEASPAASLRFDAVLPATEIGAPLLSTVKREKKPRL